MRLCCYCAFGKQKSSITNLEVHKGTPNETLNKHEDFIASLSLCLGKKISLRELSLDKIKSVSDLERLLMALLRRAILLVCQRRLWDAY